MILAERIAVGFQNLLRNRDARIPIETFLGGFGRIGIVGSHGLRQTEWLRNRRVWVSNAGDQLRAFMNRGWRNLKCKQKIVWSNLFVVNASFVVLVEPA